MTGQAHGQTEREREADREREKPTDTAMKTDRSIKGQSHGRTHRRLTRVGGGDYGSKEETVVQLKLDVHHARHPVQDSAAIQTIIIIVLIGAFISIFPNRLKVPQGWKPWSLLPLGAILCVNHCPTISIYCTEVEVHLSSCQNTNLSCVFSSQVQFHLFVQPLSMSFSFTLDKPLSTDRHDFSILAERL